MAIPQIQPYDYFYQWREKTNMIASSIGDIETINLSPGDRSNTAEAINKVISNIGAFSILTTTSKSTIVAAINELDSNQDVLASNINGIDVKIGDLSSLTTTNKSNLIVAINELKSNQGALSNLNTTNKTTFVDAINELISKIIIKDASISVGSETSNTIRVSIQLKDSSGANLAIRANVFAYLSDSNDGSTLVSTAPNGGWNIGTTGILISDNTNKSARFTSSSTGSFDIDISESSAKTFYLVIVLPLGNLKVSTAITFT